MRVLITRPAPEAERTAEAVRALGHEAVLSPASFVTRLEPAAPTGDFDVVLATSANAVRHADRALLDRLARLPFLGVGARTAEAAREAGFAHVIAGGGSASDLACLALARLGQGRRALYLAGQPRKSDLEARLAAAGFQVTTHACYATTIADALSEGGAAELRAGRLGAVLHYSRESAARFAGLARTAGLDGAARAVEHLCLSADAASGLTTLGKVRVRIAEQPTEQALLILLDKDH